MEAALYIFVLLDFIFQFVVFLLVNRFFQRFDIKVVVFLLNVLGTILAFFQGVWTDQSPIFFIVIYWLVFITNLVLVKLFENNKTFLRYFKHITRLV